MLRRRLWAVGAVLAAVVMLGYAPLEAGGVVVKGVITNWGQAKGKVSDKAFFQLVKVQSKMSSRTDPEGLATLTSDLPEIPVTRWGSFKVNLGQLPPGEYMIALQRGLPSAPILVKEGKPLIFKVPGKFPLDLGKVKVEIR